MVSLPGYPNNLTTQRRPNMTVLSACSPFRSGWISFPMLAALTLSVLQSPDAAAGTITFNDLSNPNSVTYDSPATASRSTLTCVSGVVELCFGNLVAPVGFVFGQTGLAASRVIGEPDGVFISDLLNVGVGIGDTSASISWLSAEGGTLGPCSFRGGVQYYRK